MITSKDVRVEIKKAEETISKESSPAIKALFKLITIVIKIALGNRTNTVKIMDKLGIPRAKQKREEKVEEVE